MSHNATDGGRAGILLMQAPGEVAALASIASGLECAGHMVRCLQPAALAEDGVKAARWWDWYAGAEATLAGLRRQCDVVVAGGMGAGAALGLLLAANHPKDVQATALFAPTLWLNGQLAPWAAHLLCLALGRRTAEGIGLSRRLPVRGIPDEALSQHRRLLQAARSVLKSVSQPTLIVHTREDCCAGLDSAGYLQRNLRGLVDMVVLRGGAQAEGLDRQRDLIVEKVVAFAATVARRSLAAAGRPSGAPVAMLKAKAA